MKRTEIQENLKLVQAEILKIEEKREAENTIYHTKDKYLDGFGRIPEIETVEELVRAQGAIIEFEEATSKSFQPAMARLGVTESEMPSIKTPVKLLGFLPKYWNMDLKTRLGVLREDARLEKLKNAEKNLKKHLSEDDKFELDTAGIEALLTMEQPTEE